MRDLMPDPDELRALVRHMRNAGTDLQLVEVKAAKSALPKDIGSSISAFANSTGGLIICGLDEKSGFLPVEGFDPSRIQDALSHFCSDAMTPVIRPLIELMPFEGAILVVAYIAPLPPNERPCYVTAREPWNGSFIRSGDGDHRLSRTEVTRLMSEHVQPVSDKSIVPDATLDDLDSDLVRGLVARERLLRPRGFGGLTDTQVLRRLLAITEDDAGVLRPTLAGLLSLGTYPQQFFPRLSVAFTSYPYTMRCQATPDGRRFLDAARCEGPIPLMIEDTLRVIARNTRCGARIDGLDRHDVPEYPMDAIREAVANALMHRDYSPGSHGASVSVDLFPDRLEITSPGGLFGSLTIDSLGDPTLAASRNHFLSRILESTPRPDGGFMVENRGTGMGVIQDSLWRAGMDEAVIHESPSAFQIIFKGTDDDLTSGMTPFAGMAFTGSGPWHPNAGMTTDTGISHAPTAFPKETRMVLELNDLVLQVIKIQGSATTADIVKASGKSRPTVLKSIRSLLESGRIIPNGSKNSPKQRYRLSQSVDS